MNWRLKNLKLQPAPMPSLGDSARPSDIRGTYLINDVRTENGFFHVSLVRLDDRPDAVDHVAHLRREVAIRMFQKLGHQDFSVFIGLQVN